MENALSEQFVFNKSVFKRKLKKETNPLPLFKQTLKDSRAFLIDEFHTGKDIERIVIQQVRITDQLLISAWELFITGDELSLIAVGGYGRSELMLASDIDLMVLQKSRLKKHTTGQLESFLTFLWDFGLEVGHSVRSAKECRIEAKNDITIMTNIMESRFLCGNQKLYDEMKKNTSTKKVWPTKKFFEAKLEEQVQRHKKYSESEHKLEPNVKESPGGLRDIQMITWVAKRHYDNISLRTLIENKLLTREEYKILKTGRNLLWRIRYALHITTQRREDRLLFEFQRSVAELFGYKSNDNKGIEEFMKMYFRTVREMNRLNEMLLQHFKEEIVSKKRRQKIVPINSRFQKNNNYIEVVNKNIFKSHQYALLEIFLLVQQDPDIIGIKASTIRLIRNHLHFINDKFRNDIRNKSLFLEILKQPNLVGHQLRRMHRYGVLGAYIPVFKKIEGLMQFDLFHVFTVDEHILTVVKNMRLFGLHEYADEFPVCHLIIKKLPKLELLYIAGLFHDIAKGRGGDHSKLGAKDALEFCKLHQLSDYDAKLVAWLVDKHLLMSKTAQREDIDDPDTIMKFADKVRDQNHLNYLYVLSVADICGTNPELWNSWRASLLINLYQRTLHELRRGKEKPVLIMQRIKNTKLDALKFIQSKKVEQSEITALWKTLGNDYFLRHQIDEIAWHTLGILEHQDKTKPLVMVKHFESRGGCLIFVYMKDKKNIFTSVCSAIERLGLNVLDARIITSHKGYVLDTFIVLEDDGKIIYENERILRIKETILKALESDSVSYNPNKKISNRQLKSFSLPTLVSFSNDEKNNRTIMEVSTKDKPGVLFRIGSAINMCGARLQGAKIATYGERAEDIFYLSNKDNNPITDELKFECLKKSIIETLSA